MDQYPIAVERKWRVQALPNVSGCEGKAVSQGYMAIAADGTEVRLRQTDGTCVQTVKREGGLVRDEIEVERSREPFETLWPATAGRRLAKTR